VIIQRMIWGVIAAVVLVFVGDLLWAKHLMANPNMGLGTVMVRHEWDVPRKDGRVEFDIDPPQPETCIHSMFPHFGYAPCWYAVRHTRVVN